MKITVDGEVHDFDMGSVTNLEGMHLERVTGGTFQEWAKSLEAGSMLALTALVWLIRRRAEPNLRFDDVVFKLASVEIDDGDEQAVPKEDSPPTG